MKNLAELKERLFELETTIVSSFSEQKNRNREMFSISAEIELLENPESYNENPFWSLHENRF